MRFGIQKYIYYYKNEAYLLSNLTTFEIQLELNIPPFLDADLSGFEEENKVFDCLQTALEECDTKDTVVISGWNVKLDGK
jgi:hypothetical protein